MVNEESEGLDTEQGVGDNQVGAVDGIDSITNPVQIEATIELDVGNGRKHVADFVVETEEDGAFGILVLGGERKVNAYLIAFLYHVLGKTIVAEHGGQLNFMTQQAKIMRNVSGHATMMEGDRPRSAAFRNWLRMWHYGNVDVGLSYDGDAHDFRF